MRARKSIHILAKVRLKIFLSTVCSLDVSHFFRNYYSIDMLLRIVEEYPDEFKILGSSALNLLCRDSLVQGLFKQFGACEKLIS